MIVQSYLLQFGQMLVHLFKILHLIPFNKCGGSFEPKSSYPALKFGIHQLEVKSFLADMGGAQNVIICEAQAAFYP